MIFKFNQLIIAKIIYALFQALLFLLFFKIKDAAYAILGSVDGTVTFLKQNRNFFQTPF